VTAIWYIVGFAFAGVSFVFLTIGMAWLISHRNRGDVHKGLPYESGIDTYGDTHARFGLSFYIYALLFVAFDIEVIFIYLWALVFRQELLGGPRQHAHLRRDPPARPGLRLAQGCADVAVRSGSGGSRARTRAAAPTSNVPAVVPGGAELTEPIVVANALWQSSEPLAYLGGSQNDITHLAEVEASGLGRRDDARWAVRSRSSRPRPTTSWTWSGRTACGRSCRASPAARSR